MFIKVMNIKNKTTKKRRKQMDKEKTVIVKVNVEVVVNAKIKKPAF
jgi:hypothetical protein